MTTPMEREAMFNPKFLKGFKDVMLVSKPLNRTPKKIPVAVNGTTADRLEGGTERFFSPEEIAQKIKERDIGEGNGFVGDILLGSVKGIGNKVTRAVKKDKNVEWSGSSAIDNASAKVKAVSRDLSTRSGQKVIDAIGGNKPGSVRQKLFSTLEEVPIGERVLEDGSIIPIIEKQRRASIFSPVQNTMKVGTPILGSMYLAEKMYPMEERDSPSIGEMTDVAQQLSQPVMHNFPTPGHGRLASDDIAGLEKQAMLTKQAELELKVTEKEARISSLNQELEWMEKRATESDERAATFEKRAASLQRDLHSERSAHQELLLRVAARERSGEAVKIARSMLEKGLIKQAEYEGQVDKLMDCSEEELLLFEKMASFEKLGEESIETLAFLSDTYSSNAEPKRRVQKGLSKSGQTIAEAVREINASRNGG